MAKPGKAEEKEVEKWFQRTNLGIKFRESDNRKDAWTNAKKYYRNFFDEKTVSVNLIFAHGRQLVPLLYFKNPVVECAALRPGFERLAKLQEAVDNMLIKRMRVKEQLKLIIQDTFLYDYGVRKVGYDSEYGYDPTGSLWKDLFIELNIEITDEELTDFNTFTISEFPFFVHVPPSRFGVDTDVEGPTLDTAEWVFEEFYRPVSDVLEDKRYNSPKDLRASHILNKDSRGNVVISPKTIGVDFKGKSGESSDVERIKLYEIWDKRERKVYVIAEGCKGFLREQEDVWNLENFFPYDRLCFNPVSDEHYSTSDASYVERQQLELNDIRTQEMAHRRKENTKWIGKRGVLRNEEKEKFLNGTPQVFVEIDGNPDSDLKSVSSNMSRDIFMAATDVRSDFQEILRMGKNQLSQEMGRRKTATEAIVINQYTEMGGDERRDIVSDFLEKSIRDINRLVYNFWDQKAVIKLVGPEGAEWVEWNGEMLDGEYGISILPNSTLPASKELYRNKVGSLVQQYINDPYINQKELRRLHLDAFEEFDTNKLLLQEPDQTQAMVDFRPGQSRHGEEGGGSRIQTPELGAEQDMSRMMGEQTGQGGE